MSEPTDMALYKEVKNKVDKSYDKPSAYRSMAYTRFYSEEFKKKYGNDKKPYKGAKPGNLNRWRNEKWIDVKSFLENPKNPTSCGNEPVKKGEYPLCMPEKQVSRYSKQELQLLVERKNEIGKRRLVKDTFLRDVLKPDEIPKERIYKQKYQNDGRLKLPKPVKEKEAKEIIKQQKEPKVKEPKEPKVKEPKEPKEPSGAVGRPKISPEQRQANITAYEERRKEKRLEQKIQYVKSPEYSQKLKEREAEASEKRSRAYQHKLVEQQSRREEASQRKRDARNFNPFERIGNEEERLKYFNEALSFD